MHRSRIFIAALALLACAGASVLGGAAPAQTMRAAAKKITATGVGAVKLGRTHGQLRSAALVGRLITERCPDSGALYRYAHLRPPLKGSVQFSRARPYRAITISINRGATARGVAVGSGVAQLRTAFPQAIVEKTGAQYGILSVKVPKAGGGPIEFWIDIAPQKVELIGIPNLPVVCMPGEM
jgi:hypothetical protein